MSVKKIGVICHFFVNLKYDINNYFFFLELDNDNLASQIIMFFAAGFEPPAVVMAFCLFELAKNQEVQKKLRKQINSALMENEKITYDMVNVFSVTYFSVKGKELIILFLLI